MNLSHIGRSEQLNKIHYFRKIIFVTSSLRHSIECQKWHKKIFAEENELSSNHVKRECVTAKYCIQNITWAGKPTSIFAFGFFFLNFLFFGLDFLLLIGFSGTRWKCSSPLLEEVTGPGEIREMSDDVQCQINT